MPFFLSLDHSYRLTVIWKFFPRGSQVGCGNLEWAIHILARTVCTRCLCTQTNPTKPNWTRTSPARSHTPNEMKDAQKSKAKWQECTKKMVKWCPEIKSQVARVPPKDGKLMPKSLKPNGINAKPDFSVPLDLWPGKVSASSLFSSGSFKQFLVDFLPRRYSIISCFRSF